LPRPCRKPARGAIADAVVAELGQRRLEPAVLQKVKTLLGGEISLASLASWPDGVRLLRPETTNWHFVDIPYEATAYDAAEHCKPSPKGDCVIAAIRRLRDVLRDNAASAQDRKEALIFLVHFLGDIHQPLHCAERNNDSGGNKVAVIFLDRGGHPHETNLHAVWDEAIIDKRVYDWGEYVRIVEDDWLKGRDIAALQAGELEDWAWKTHLAAVQVAYDLPKNHVLDDDYYKKAAAMVDQQLALGGVRLARILNETLR
jgi:hypothetical protein